MQVSLESKGAESFQTARGCCVPFGVMEWAISQLPDQQQQQFKQLLQDSETAPVEALSNISSQLQVSNSSLTGHMLVTVACVDDDNLQGRSQRCKFLKAGVQYALQATWYCVHLQSQLVYQPHHCCWRLYRTL